MQTGLKSTSKWHEVVLVIPSTLTLVVFPSLHQSTSVVSWEVPYNELSKEKKTLKPDLPMGLYGGLVPPNSRQLRH